MNRSCRHLWVFIIGILTASSVYGQDLDSDLLNDLPRIGKWVMTARGKPADWLGVKFENKALYGPINVALVDQISATEQESQFFLERQCALCGFQKKLGHSSGYQNEVNGILLKQIPREWGTAFSDNDFWNENNHGVFFGPLKTAIGFVYTGSFSRESFVVFSWIHHRYVSFEKARQNLVDSLERTGRIKGIGRVSIGNAEDPQSSISTGDHDGSIVVMKRIQ